MSFVSFAFLGLYLVALAARALIGRSKQGSAYLATLLVLSLLFYGWHVPSYLVLLLFSTVVDYVIGLRLAAVPMERVGLRRLLLTLSMVTNLGLLCVFKYTGLLLDMIWKSMPDLQPSFDTFAAGLKARVESGRS